ncbi:MAG: hypothetical protein AAF235_04900, partial [Planctomycetota bacterium]
TTPPTIPRRAMTPAGLRAGEGPQMPTADQPTGPVHGAPHEPSAPAPETAGVRARAARLLLRIKKAPGRRTAGAVISVVLFAAAIYAVLTQRGQLEDARGAIAGAPPLLIAAAFALPVVNLVLVSAAFRVLTLRHGHVGRIEMLSLITSAWLLNHLPMRPGMVGRFAYHKKRNGIRLADTGRVLVESIVLSATAVVLLFAVAILLSSTREPLSTQATVLLVASPAAAGGLVTAALAMSGSSWWRYAAAWSLRYADVAVWVARYAVVFALVGAPLSVDRAVLVAAVSQAVLLVPIAGNGLGLREWAIGLTAEAGLIADVLNRVAELTLAVCLGLPAGWDVARRLSQPRQSRENAAQTPASSNADTPSPKNRPVTQTKSEDIE